MCKPAQEKCGHLDMTIVVDWLVKQYSNKQTKIFDLVYTVYMNMCAQSQWQDI